MGAQKYYSQSADETEALGQKIGTSLSSGQVFCLTGELGSGKTVFTQGLARSLGVKQRVLSPTFVLRRDYPLRKKGLKSFHHLDFYRLSDSGEAESLGLDQLYADPGAVVVIEWGEKIPEVLPKHYWQVTFKTENDRREIVYEQKNSA